MMINSDEQLPDGITRDVTLLLTAIPTGKNFSLHSEVNYVISCFNAKKCQFYRLRFCTGKISKDHCKACCASTESTTVSTFQAKITKLQGDIRGWAKQEVKRQLK